MSRPLLIGELYPTRWHAQTGAGQVLDFHALRMTYITHLRLAGVRLDMAKRLARHSDIKLTEDIYTDFDLMAGPERQAAEMLAPERRRQRFVPKVR